MPFEPVVDGRTLPDLPVERLRRGVGSDVDILVGTNSEEGNFFFVPTGVVGTEDPEAVIRFARARGYSGAVPAAYRAARPSATGGELISAIMTDGFYRIPALEVAEGHQGSSYLYEFAWRSPAFNGAMGACHALELPFVFDTLSEPGYARLLGPRPPQEVADSMHRAWISFAATGNPGWDPYTDGHPISMRFDLEEEAMVEKPMAEWAAWGLAADGGSLAGRIEREQAVIRPG